MSRQLTLQSKGEIINDFIVKLRRSGYNEKSVDGIVKSGLGLYYRKLEIDLQGGPPLNSGGGGDEITRRRSKASASQDWFSRRRGGKEETLKKDNSWRIKEQQQQGAEPKVGGARHRVWGRRTQSPSKVPQPKSLPDQENPRKTISTLLVPFTVGSGLQRVVQEAEDTFSSLVGSARVRVVEQGGDTLINLLGRNDPWAARGRCSDPACLVCSSRIWLRDQEKQSRKSGQKLPGELITETSTQCRREGSTYCLQCLPCLHLGRRSTYVGESSRSTRQRGQEHERDLKSGVVSSPLVLHTIEEHGV